MSSDDEAMLRDILKEALSGAGYRVETAASAETALAVMRANPCWVLFVDLKLPGTNGIELCAKIRKEWPIAVLYAITGFASLFELNDCREAGFEDCFLKPLDLKLIVKTAGHAFTKMERWTKR